MLTTVDAAGYLSYLGRHTTPNSLRRMRSRGRGPAFVCVGRNVFYKQFALDEFLTECTECEMGSDVGRRLCEGFSMLNLSGDDPGSGLGLRSF